MIPREREREPEHERKIGGCPYFPYFPNIKSKHLRLIQMTGEPIINNLEVNKMSNLIFNNINIFIKKTIIALLFSILFFIIINCQKSNSIIIGNEQIKFMFDNKLRLLDYINKDNPKITLLSDGLEMIEYDIPYLVEKYRGLIIVHEIIPYEGIYTSISIFNNSGDLLKKLDAKPLFAMVAPNGLYFVLIEDSHANFNGHISFYNYIGEMIVNHTFSEYGPSTGFMMFDKDSNVFIIENGGGFQNINGTYKVKCKYLIYNFTSSNLSEIDFPNCFCNFDPVIIFKHNKMTISAKDKSFNYIYIYSINGSLISNKSSKLY